jgi:hypothetical protein
MSDPDKIIHVVSFNIPYPPDYGGVMDIFYKIKALKKEGVGVILHCFSYGRSRSRTLETECLRVHYYQRNLNLFLFLRQQPFIVTSRENEKLLADLTEDNYPIIFEGIHSTAYLGHPSLDGRMKMVRTHNIEHLYYRNLARVEKNVFRKFYFNLEANRLERYEPNLSEASLLFPISPADTKYFAAKFGKTLFVGPFHNSDVCSSLPGKGKYILLHGDFSTPENNSAALYLIREVISKWSYQTIIAGKKPSAEIFHEVSKLKHVKIIPNPPEDRMSDLIRNSQICLIHSTHRTGMKLKLINSLSSGRHIIASEAVTSGTRLESLCHLATTCDEWRQLADELMVTIFTPEMCDSRNKLLTDIADNRVNARRIIESTNNYNVHS